MRAISLWQPWASAVALGSKRIETRHWSTDYRGPLAIHAAKRCVKGELIVWHCSWTWCGALAPLGVRMGQNEQLWEFLPFGAIVAVVNLVDCRSTEAFDQAALDKIRFAADSLGKWTERQMGNFEPGRYGWVLDDIRPLKEPIPFRGAQGFFNVPDGILATASKENQ